ncbi:fumarylacetoacetate hydrolase family protein [Phenylobacterium montanum]|uniref:Fumarylacetoacetate hydrolase family protein n=1 Tax=Phenylobacterium montanum TaxID=2823693 RepID=A0A975IUT1_9CAUL|nr:fumarylacetoacetate hydrolase family protein [Caulobacter sp. S6]QUD88113.1 fumarylacetoacetate hydrolase family protein [Caulobacter sp. S6]
MKLATYDRGSGPRCGVVLGETIVDLGREGDLLPLIVDWDRLRPEVEEIAAAGGGVPLSSVRLRAPVLRPGKIFAIGLNYADHIEESKMERPQHQVWFTKAQTSVNGPFDPIQIPRASPFVDYEVELVAVIGRRGRHITREQAPAHIFGWCVGDDVTERMWQHRTPQWSLGKSFDTHAPFGPWITTADEIPDPHALAIRCSVNGEARQTSNTRHLVFDVFDQIAHLSQAMTLEPGDVIFTGTPGGVGAAMDPRQFLKAGDMVCCEIEGLGHIENRCEAEG